MTLTRKQYDFLVNNHQNWMDAKWGLCRKQWSLGGVKIFAASWVLHEIKVKLLAFANEVR